MDRRIEPGLEVEPSTSSQVVAQADEDKYYIRSERLNHPIYDQSSHPAFDRPNYFNDQSQEKSQGCVKAIGVMVIIVILIVAVALGVGLGVGLSARHKQNSANDAPNTSADTDNAPVTITKSINAPTSATKLGNIATSTSITATQSGQIATVTPTPDILPSRGCPATNGSTYTATNKLSRTDTSQIPDSSLKFEILCDTTSDEGGSLMDLQLIADVSTLDDCLDFCALYDFQMRQENYPAHACTGASWGYGNNPHIGPRYICWLRNNVTLGSANTTSLHKGYDSGILLLDN